MIHVCAHPHLQIYVNPRMSSACDESPPLLSLIIESAEERGTTRPLESTCSLSIAPYLEPCFFPHSSFSLTWWLTAFSPEVCNAGCTACSMTETTLISHRFHEVYFSAWVTALAGSMVLFDTQRWCYSFMFDMHSWFSICNNKTGIPHTSTTKCSVVSDSACRGFFVVLYILSYTVLSQHRR